MPRRNNGPARSTGMRAPSRPTAPAPAPAPARPATTAAAPPHAAAPTQAAAPVQSSGGGMLSQIASTAAGVAIGSTVGHAIGGLFSGGSAPAETVQAAPVNTQSQYQAGNCGPALAQFTKCMDEQGGNMQICNWYLEQLKACQAASGQ
ncbi:related to small unique nuclear receptor co-repressor [Cephalotrichum gorgonifer]|uniref:Related to small unique nuclear receptor co-repressor n=1 Tax=Cephalotrichum gorgonifer TaxID=2041049 RepID=A0AAE8SSS2_9PEZI|nr:related to small unique nuclear receptor co-repressor [Cephalotrichum gorgonifer]